MDENNNYSEEESLDENDCEDLYRNDSDLEFEDNNLDDEDLISLEDYLNDNQTNKDRRSFRENYEPSSEQHFRQLDSFNAYEESFESEPEFEDLIIEPTVDFQSHPTSDSLVIPEELVDYSMSFDSEIDSNSPEMTEIWKTDERIDGKSDFQTYQSIGQSMESLRQIPSDISVPNHWNQSSESTDFSEISDDFIPEVICFDEFSKDLNSKQKTTQKGSKSCESMLSIPNSFEISSSETQKISMNSKSDFDYSDSDSFESFPKAIDFNANNRLSESSTDLSSISCDSKIMRTKSLKSHNSSSSDSSSDFAEIFSDDSNSSAISEKSVTNPWESMSRSECSSDSSEDNGSVISEYSDSSLSLTELESKESMTEKIKTIDQKTETNEMSIDLKKTIEPKKDSKEERHEKWENTSPSVQELSEIRDSIETK